MHGLILHIIFYVPCLLFHKKTFSIAYVTLLHGYLLLLLLQINISFNAVFCLFVAFENNTNFSYIL